jgi:membrane-associated phospholipid phosphatase
MPTEQPFTISSALRQNAAHGLALGLLVAMPRRAGVVLGRAWRNLAPQDALLLGLHAFLTVRVSLAPPSPTRTLASGLTASLLLVALATVLLCRGEILPAGRFRAMLYRTLALACFGGSYFEMRYVLAALQAPLQDGVLLAIDLRFLGLTPAVWLERWLSPWSTQWFSFFYYGYLWLVVAFLVGSAAFDRSRARLQEILVAAAVVTTVGHASYTLVPAIGPYGTLAFRSPIPQVFWWERCQDLVHSGGALLDVFPSLHTAFPTLFALHAFRHRRDPLFREVWRVAAFFAANIIVSTMFLRWHYAIDVVAGLALAWGAQRTGVVCARRELVRQRAGRQPTFEPVR